MKPTKLNELLYWSYANLAMAHAALLKGSNKYGPSHYSIRAKLYKGLMNGTMKIGSLYDDTKLKLTSQSGCVYCGVTIIETI